jgi:hypothetical protein
VLDVDVDVDVQLANGSTDTDCAGGSYRQVGSPLDRPRNHAAKLKAQGRASF